MSVKRRKKKAPPKPKSQFGEFLEEFHGEITRRIAETKQLAEQAGESEDEYAAFVYAASNYALQHISESFIHAAQKVVGVSQDG